MGICHPQSPLWWRIIFLECRASLQQQIVESPIFRTVYSQFSTENVFLNFNKQICFKYKVHQQQQKQLEGNNKRQQKKIREILSEYEKWLHQTVLNKLSAISIFHYNSGISGLCCGVLDIGMEFSYKYRAICSSLWEESSKRNLARMSVLNNLQARSNYVNCFLNICSYFWLPIFFGQIAMHSSR